ncbi:hypothetical protein GP486_000735 [Trichoglossum hirsutum]|uniref:BRCT domain-containing protein n=1 Tax=Trichoglossum hirsutum TaxID=265104 RepID=A0A9P8RTS4_9PEZI|nr:hypothetical protein GP486_000735 [Trichoglossum hirsutum]
MEKQASLDIQALQQLILGPIPGPSRVAGQTNVDTTSDSGYALDDPERIACTTDRRHDHDDAQARAQLSPTLRLPTAAKEELRVQSQLPLKKMSTQGSEEKTQEIGEEELAELSKKLQEDHAQRSSRIDVVESGHIDLLKSFEQSYVDRYDEDEDIDDDSGGESQVRAEVFPETKRFQQPATPATDRKKQIRIADFTTPRLPANPLAQHGTGSPGIIPMSQAFKFTQPSSPHRKAISSDLAYELPSPAVFNAFRSPILPVSSSPTSPAAMTANMAFNEPGSTGVAVKRSEKQNARRALRSPPANNQIDEDSSDDCFDRSAEERMFRRKRAKQKIEEETRKQFEMVTAPSREAMNTKGKKREREKAQDKGVKTKTYAIPLISDDITRADAVSDGNTTEGESGNNMTARKENGDAVDAGRNVQAHIATSRAELDTKKDTTDRENLSPFRQRQPLRQGYQGDEHTSVPYPEQLLSVKDNANADKLQGTSSGAVARVVEVENSQPSLSQVRPGETQHTNISALPSLPSSLGSGFLVSRSQDDEVPLSSRVNRVFADGYNEQSSYLPQPPSSLSIRDGSSPLGGQPRSQEFPSVCGKASTCSQDQTAYGTRQGPEIRRAIIERSSPPPFIVSKVVECGDPALGTTMIGNGKPIEDSGSPQQSASVARLENPDIGEIRTPVNAKPRFSASETTIPETSPAIGRVSCLPLNEHLNRTPQPSPIPHTKDGKKWSQDITVGRQYMNQSSGSNIFETAPSHLSSLSTSQNYQSRTSSRQGASVKDSETRNPRDLISDQTRPKSVNQDVNLITDNSRNVENDFPLPAPANKRRKGVGGCIIPETGIEPLSPVTADKEAEPSESRDERSPSDTGHIKVLNSAVTVDKGKRKPLIQAEKVHTLSKGLEELAEPNPGAGAASLKTREINSGPPISKAIVPRAKAPRPGPPRSLHADKSPLQNPSVAKPNPDSEVIEPNRVLALFKDGNMSYYPATCRFVIGIDNPRLKVCFDDGTEDLLEPQNVRRFDLRLGDVVKVDLDNMRTKNYVVCGFQDPKDTNVPPASPRRNRGDPKDYPSTDVWGHSTVLLQQKQRDSFPSEASSLSGEEISAPISSVYIVKSMWHKFNDRVYTHISDFFRPSSRGQTPGGLYSNSNPITPTRARRMTPSVLGQADNSESLGATLKPTRGIFTGMAFAVTYLSEEAEKEQIVKGIVGNGGKVLHDGFEELFQTDWFTVASGDHHSFRLKRSAEKYSFACVIANNYSRKPKFIGALALGLPCLHGRWIKDCTKKNEVVDWDPYLLPAGESNYLGGSARSRVLQHYSPLTAQLPNTIASRPKPLESQSVILIMGNGKAEDRRKVFLFLIFALGASKVSKVSNFEAARRLLADAESNAESWDWICVDDGHVKDARRVLHGKAVPPRRKRKRSATEGEGAECGIRFPKVKIMSDEYVMQTVVMGKLMPE